MVSLQGIAVAVVGFAVALGCAGVVYRDATRLEISRPALWAGIVFATCGGALALYLAPPDVPIPGLLVIVVGARRSTCSNATTPNTVTSRPIPTRCRRGQAVSPRASDSATSRRSSGRIARNTTRLLTAPVQRPTT